MLFTITTTSDNWKSKRGYKKEINTLEELMQFAKDAECEIIITNDNEGVVLEIYDDYRE